MWCVHNFKQTDKSNSLEKNRVKSKEACTLHKHPGRLDCVFG